MKFRADIQVILGVILGLLGIVFTLQDFEGIPLGDVQLFWPMLVIAFGLSRIFEPSGRLQGWVLLIVGTVVQLSNLGLFILPAYEVVRYWPLAVCVGRLLGAGSP